MPDRIHLTVAAVIARDDKFLMVREHDNGREVINQPAGHVEPGETLQEAALREVLEETGWQVRLTALLGLTHYTAPSNGKIYYRVSFVAEPIAQNDNAVLDSDIIAAEWMALEQLQNNPHLRSPMVLSDIIKYLNKIIYPLEFIENIEQRRSS